MNEKTENGETCLRLKQGYTETGPQPVPHGIATGRREIWVLALQPAATRKLCSCTVHSPCTEHPFLKIYTYTPLTANIFQFNLNKKLKVQTVISVIIHLKDNKSTIMFTTGYKPAVTSLFPLTSRKEES